MRTMTTARGRHQHHIRFTFDQVQMRLNILDFTDRIILRVQNHQRRADAFATT